MAAAKRVVVTGATGLIGQRLCARLEAKGYRVVVFSRDPQRAKRSMRNGAEFVAWTPSEGGDWTSAIDGAYAVINLAGANLFAKRWSEAYKKQIVDSRVIGTRGLVNAMRDAQQKPQVFISGSGVNYYGFHDDTKLDESAGPGDDFLARLCVAWEKEAQRAEELGVRTVVIRTGFVLSPPKSALPISLKGISPSRPGFVLDFESGALGLMSFPFRLFAGGPIGSGKQWVSWIHLDDEVGLILMALEDERVSGPLNAAAPESMTNREFSKTIGKVLNRPSWLPVPGFALKALLGPVSNMIVEGQRVVPAKAQALGYQFRYPTAEAALQHLLGR